MLKSSGHQDGGKGTKMYWLYKDTDKKSEAYIVRQVDGIVCNDYTWTNLPYDLTPKIKAKQTALNKNQYLNRTLEKRLEMVSHL